MTRRERLGEHARPPLDPADETTIISLKLPKRLLQTVDKTARERDLTRSQAMREALREWAGR